MSFTSVADQTFKPVLGIGSGGLPPADGVSIGQPAFQEPTVDSNGNQLLPGGSAPGVGGKSGGPFAQIPIDQSGNVLDSGMPGLGGKGGAQYGATQQLPADNNLPQPPEAMPLGAEQGGTPGRPVPAAPMSPRGPGFSNPGAPGAPMQTPQPVGPASRPPLMGNSNPDTYFNRYAQQLGLPQKPLTGNFQPRPIGNLSPQPLGKPPVVGQITKPNKGIGTTYGPLIRGAGRGGILR